MALKAQLEKEKPKLACCVHAAEKAKSKPTIDDLTAKVAKLEKDVAKATVSLTGHYVAYGKLLDI